MIHSYNCSDLLVSIVTESDFLDHGLVLRKFERTCKHKHVFHSAYRKPRTCLFFSWKLIMIELRMQKGAKRTSITQLLRCIEIADHEERLQLLQREAGKDSIFV